MTNYYLRQTIYLTWSGFSLNRLALLGSFESWMCVGGGMCVFGGSLCFQVFPKTEMGETGPVWDVIVALDKSLSLTPNIRYSSEFRSWWTHTLRSWDLSFNLVRSISPESFERFLLSFTQIHVFVSMRPCVEPITQLHRLKVKVTLQDNGILRRRI